MSYLHWKKYLKHIFFFFDCISLFVLKEIVIKNLIFNNFFHKFKGLMPANIIHVSTGLVLHDIEKMGMNLSVNKLILFQKNKTIFFQLD